MSYTYDTNLTYKINYANIKSTIYLIYDCIKVKQKYFSSYDRKMNPDDDKNFCVYRRKKVEKHT